MRCSACGFENEAGSAVCGLCGAALAGGAPSSPVAEAAPRTPAVRIAAAEAPHPRPAPGLAAIVGFGVAMLLLGGAGAYLVLAGTRGMPGGPAGSAPPPSPPQLQAYKDPMGRFTIAYPHGWRVAVESSLTRFYRDDIVTGPQFLVYDPDAKPMTLTPAKRLAILADTMSDEGRSMRALNLTIEEGAHPTELGSIDFVEALAAPRRGRTVLRFAQTQDGSTIEVADVQYDAPQDAFASFEPFFVQMFKSYHPR